MPALTVKELSVKFNMSEQTVKEICKTKGSPAYKIGTGKYSPWACYDDKFEQFIIKLADKYKG